MSTKREKILELLEGGGSILFEQLQGEIGGNKTHTYRILGEMEADGVMTVLESGGFNFYSLPRPEVEAVLSNARPYDIEPKKLWDKSMGVTRFVHNWRRADGSDKLPAAGVFCAWTCTYPLAQGYKSIFDWNGFSTSLMNDHQVLYESKDALSYKINHPASQELAAILPTVPPPWGQPHREKIGRLLNLLRPSYPAFFPHWDCDTGRLHPDGGGGVMLDYTGRKVFRSGWIPSGEIIRRNGTWS